MGENKSVESKRSVGSSYEKLAGAFLEENGYEILEYNFYSHAGEIDIVARHEGYLVFVEVKYRRNLRKGHPLEAVSMQKQKVISQCAQYYLYKNHCMESPARFDVVGILGEEISVIQNAFSFVI